VVAVDIVVRMEEGVCGENVGGGWTAVAVGAVVRREGGVSVVEDNRKVRWREGRARCDRARRGVFDAVHGEWVVIVCVRR